MRQTAEEILTVFTADLLRAKAYPDVIWFHVPNGEHRHISVAKKLKAMGVLAGVPDFVFVMPAAPTFACVKFLELKTPSGNVSKSQREFFGRAARTKAPCAIARTPAEIITTLKRWLIIPERTKA